MGDGRFKTCRGDGKGQVRSGFQGHLFLGLLLKLGINFVDRATHYHGKFVFLLKEQYPGNAIVFESISSNEHV